MLFSSLGMTSNVGVRCIIRSLEVVELVEFFFSQNFFPPCCSYTFMSVCHVFLGNNLFDVTKTFYMTNFVVLVCTIPGR
jgi:hypothetical protein